MKAKVIKTGEIVEVYRNPSIKKTNIFIEAVFVNDRMWTEDELDFCIGAEEFPEKIYTYGGEYIRTDAFIERACAWLEKHTFSELNLDFGHSLEIKEFVDRFKDYMKGG